MCTKPWIRWEPCTSVSDGCSECSLRLVTSRHTRLEWSTASSTTSFTPAEAEGRSHGQEELPHHTQLKSRLRFYSARCAAAAPPRGRARAPVRQQLRSHGPGHPGERRRAASTLPAPKPPAASASPFPPACLQTTSAKTSSVFWRRRKIHSNSNRDSRIDSHIKKKIIDFSPLSSQQKEPSRQQNSSLEKYNPLHDTEANV